MSLKEAKKAELIALGYPWPKSLDDKSLLWLEAEIKATTPSEQPEDRPE